MTLKPQARSLAIVTLAAVAAIGAAGGVLAFDRSKGAPDAVLPQAADGHYWAMGRSDGGAVRLLVDTGATRVSLTPADAERLGVAVQDLDFVETVQTPAGPARAARVTLDWLAVGPARLDRVEALVFEDGLGASLLGMSYLGRLDRVAVRDGAMRLAA